MLGRAPDRSVGIGKDRPGCKARGRGAAGMSQPMNVARCLATA